MIAAKRAEATKLLQHYFRTVYQKVGLRWDGDNDVEVAGIVEALFDDVDASVEHLQGQLDQPDWRQRV